MRSPVTTLALWLVPLVACGDDAAPGSGDGGGSSSTGPTTVASTTSSGGGRDAAGGAGGGDASGGGGGGEPFQPDVIWEPCSLSSDLVVGDGAECATVEVPVLWEDPSAGTIEIFVKRRLAARQPAAAQVWFLNGGPGYSGADYEPLVEAIAAAEPTLDLYMPDHRGVGRSSRLGCEAGEDPAGPAGRGITDEELPPCMEALVAEWGDRLDGFTTSQAARDLGALVEVTRAPGMDVIVDGGSYGSHWAHRYLQLFPQQPTALLFDAVAVNSDLAQIDRYFDELAHRWATLCASDAFCSEKLGPDPAARWAAGLDALDAGACPGVAELFDRPTLHAYWAYFFYTWDLRPLILPMAYRLERCEPRDVAAFQRFHEIVTAPPPPPTAAERYFSPMLGNHVKLSEMWTDTTLEEHQAFVAAALVTHGSVAPTIPVQASWPRYPEEELFGQLAEEAPRTLILHGEYDFLPVDEVVTPTVEHFAGPTSQYVEVARAPHSTFASPIEPGTPTCGTRILMQLLRDPRAPVDASCNALVQPIDLDVSSALALGVFGTSDAWDGTPTGDGAPAPRLLRGGPGEDLRRRVAAFAERRARLRR